MDRAELFCRYINDDSLRIDRSEVKAYAPYNLLRWFAADCAYRAVSCCKNELTKLEPDWWEDILGSACMEAVETIYKTASGQGEASLDEAQQAASSEVNKAESTMAGALNLGASWAWAEAARSILGAAQIEIGNAAYKAAHCATESSAHLGYAILFQEARQRAEAKTGGDRAKHFQKEFNALPKEDSWLLKIKEAERTWQEARFLYLNKIWDQCSSEAPRLLLENIPPIPVPAEARLEYCTIRL